MAQRLTRTQEGIWCYDDNISVARRIAESCMLTMGYDPSDWRMRDRIIISISSRVNDACDSAAFNRVEE